MQTNRKLGPVGTEQINLWLQEAEVRRSDRELVAEELMNDNKGDVLAAALADALLFGPESFVYAVRMIGIFFFEETLILTRDAGMALLARAAFSKHDDRWGYEHGPVMEMAMVDKATNGGAG